jgi:hypothetical protein
LPITERAAPESIMGLTISQCLPDLRAAIDEVAEEGRLPVWMAVDALPLLVAESLEEMF